MCRAAALYEVKMTNWLLVIVAGIILFHVFDGIKNGFIRKAVSVLSLAVTLALVTQITPMVTEFLTEHTQIERTIRETCIQMLHKDNDNEMEKADQVLAIEAMPLPDNVKELLLENNNYEVYDLLEVGGFYDYVGAYVTKMIINALSYLITFITVWAVMKMILTALNIIASLPVLRGINKLAGGVLGAAEGVVIVWVIFLAATVFCSGSLGQQIFAMIQESDLLTYLYTHNILMEVVMGLIL